MATLQADRTFWGEAQAKILKRVSSTIDQNLNGFPHIGDPKTGEWVTTPDGFWTGGFWIGSFGSPRASLVKPDIWKPQSAGLKGLNRA